MNETYIVCEGFHDRAFWGGVLDFLKCPNLGDRKDLEDPWKDPVKGEGHHAFSSAKGGFIRIVPAKGKRNVFPVASSRLRVRSTKRLARLVIGVDDDADCRAEPAAPGKSPEQAAKELQDKLCISAQLIPDGDLETDDGQTRISLVRWRTDDPPATGIPNQQTLERIICAALVAAYPQRAESVQRWLDGRPDKPKPCAKEHAWSYLAGWSADCGGYDAFISRLWKDEKVAAQLKQRLEATGVWRVAEAVANWS